MSSLGLAARACRVRAVAILTRSADAESLFVGAVPPSPGAKVQAHPCPTPGDRARKPSRLIQGEYRDSPSLSIPGHGNFSCPLLVSP